MIATETPDDREFEGLLSRIRAGDRAAKDALFTRHLPQLRAMLEKSASNLVRGRESASDLAQSVCRELLERFDRFDDYGRGEDAFRNWLFRQAERKLMDKHRYHGRARRSPVREVQAATPSHEQSLEDLIRTSHTPSRDAAAEETGRHVRAAIEQLPDHYRRVIRWLHLEGRTPQEVAAETGQTDGAVRALHTRALVKLAGILGKPATGA